MQVLHQIESMPPVHLSNTNREGLRDYFLNTWELYEWLFSSIKSDDSLYINPDPRRHPLIFYLGHTAVFYLNKFKAAGIISQGINEEFEHIFAVGVDPETAGDLETRDLWPSVDAVRSYRNEARDLILQVIEKAELDEKTSWNDPLWSLYMGLEHDRIHFETSSVLIRQYDVDLVEAPEGWQYAPISDRVQENTVIEQEGGSTIIGRHPDSDLYGWDNEYGQLEVEVAPFAVSRNMISNAEFLDFVNAGGYENKELWTESGWAWREKYAVTHPCFWVATGNDYRYRAMFDEMELPLSWPAEVTCHEANAYCKWKGHEWRLLREREWKYLSNQSPLQEDDVIFDQTCNLNLAYGSPCPV